MCSGVNTKWSFSPSSLKFLLPVSSIGFFLSHHHLRGNRAGKDIFLPRKVNAPPRPDREHSLGGILETHQVLLKKKEMRRLLYLPHLR